MVIIKEEIIGIYQGYKSEEKKYFNNLAYCFFTATREDKSIIYKPIRVKTI